MRMLFQVLATEQKEAKFKRNDSTDTVKYFELRGVDQDFTAELLAVRVYKQFDNLLSVQPNQILQVKFSGVKPSNKWEKLAVINAKQDDIQLKEQPEERPKMAVAN